MGPARFKIGREWRYRVADVEAWLADRVRTETARTRRLRKLVQPASATTEAP
jgi:hypothetical protein